MGRLLPAVSGMCFNRCLSVAAQMKVSGGNGRTCFFTFQILRSCWLWVSVDVAVLVSACCCRLIFQVFFRLNLGSYESYFCIVGFVRIRFHRF